MYLKAFQYNWKHIFSVKHNNAHVVKLLKSLTNFIIVFVFIVFHTIQILNTIPVTIFLIFIFC